MTENSALKATYVRLPLMHWQELAELAARNDRSVVAELRRAVRLHLESQRVAAPHAGQLTIGD